MPHIWCPGCGHGTVMGSLIRGIDQAGIEQNKTVIVSGIGCSGRMPGYLDFDTLHTTHGRAIAFATGIKLANPELNVIVITGDGDGAAIGGNHLVHACRRNIDLTVLLLNNQIYGMTGGQYSPMTPEQAISSTTPFGNIDQSFDLCQLTIAAGATCVGRGTVYHNRLLVKLIRIALEHKGFSFVEAYTQCPIGYGRKNKMASALEMLRWQKEQAVTEKKWSELSPTEQEGKFPIGLLFQEEREEYTARYQQIIDQIQKGVENE